MELGKCTNVTTGECTNECAQIAILTQLGWSDCTRCLATLDTENSDWKFLRGGGEFNKKIKINKRKSNVVCSNSVSG